MIWLYYMGLIDIILNYWYIIIIIRYLIKILTHIYILFLFYDCIFATIVFDIAINYGHKLLSWCKSWKKQIGL